MDYDLWGRGLQLVTVLHVNSTDLTSYVFTLRTGRRCESGVVISVGDGRRLW